MIKKTLSYVDLDGNVQNDDYYFHLSASELIEWEASREGGMVDFIERIVKESNAGAIMEEFKNLILMSIGERSDDGKRFIKDEQIKRNFRWSLAYDTLFMELATNAESAVEFIQGILPADLEKAASAVKVADELAAGTTPPKPITL